MTYNFTQYQAHTEPVLTSSVNFESNWHEPWTDPKQTIAKKAIVGAFIALIASGSFNPPAIQLEVITAGKWIYPWSEPVRLDLRKGLKPQYQQFLAFQLTQTQQPEQITESRWHQPWSEPVRFKIDKRLAVALAASGPFNPPYAGQIEPGTNYTPWFAPLAEPVRLKRGLLASLQQAFTGDTITNPTFSSPAWFAPLSEPVRLKLGLRSGAQQYLIQAASPPLVSFSYFDWLSEPVRLPNGLKAFLQRYFESPTRVIPNPIFMTMNAIETNTDQMQAAVVIANAAGGGTRVSIIEIPVPLNNPTSIRES